MISQKSRVKSLLHIKQTRFRNDEIIEGLLCLGLSDVRPHWHQIRTHSFVHRCLAHTKSDIVKIMTYKKYLFDKFFIDF